MHRVFWLLTSALFVGLLVPALVQQGMFLDGVSYAGIARNMANGLGSFAQPHYTNTLYPVCYESPPLALWTQSLFFRAFGDHYWVERLYSFSMALLTACGIVVNGRLLEKPFPGNVLANNSLGQRESFSWLPVLLWISAPIVFWAYQNNMLECTMSVFVQFSIFFAAKSILKKNWGLFGLAALLTAAAVLCKGPVGFFPVVIPFAWSLVFGTPNLLTGAIRSFGMLLLSLSFLGLFLFFYPGMQEYLDYYLHKQLLPTLAGAREKQVENPFSFLLDLLGQYILPAVFLLGLLVNRGFKAVILPKSALFFFILGVAGTLPLVMTPKQSAHYLLPAIPCFALGFAMIIWQNINWDFRMATGQKRTLEKIAGLILVATIVISWSFQGKFRRDEALIRDVMAISTQVGHGSMLGIPEYFAQNWLLHAYFERYGQVSLDAKNTRDYWLTELRGPVPDGFEEVKISGRGYRLFKRK